jgi:hypothetical protein
MYFTGTNSEVFKNLLESNLFLSRRQCLGMDLLRVSVTDITCISLYCFRVKVYVVGYSTVLSPSKPAD